MGRFSDMGLSDLVDILWGMIREKTETKKWNMIVDELKKRGFTIRLILDVQYEVDG